MNVWFDCWVKSTQVSLRELCLYVLSVSLRYRLLLAYTQCLCGSWQTQCCRPLFCTVVWLSGPLSVLVVLFLLASTHCILISISVNWGWPQHLTILCLLCFCSSTPSPQSQPQASITLGKMFCEGALCGMGYTEKEKAQKTSTRPIMLLNMAADNSACSADIIFSPVRCSSNISQSKTVVGKDSQTSEYNWRSGKLST